MAGSKTEVKDSKSDNLTSISNNDEQLNQEETWKYSPENNEVPQSKQVDNSFEAINWSASEFIQHDKGLTWYGLLAVAVAIIATGIYFLTHDKISTAVIVIVGFILGFYGARKPRLLNYQIDPTGLTIQAKNFNYESFKSFAVVEDSVLPGVVLMPLKRFMPSLSVFLDPASKEEVIKILSERLPQDTHHRDFVDRFMQRIRF